MMQPLLFASESCQNHDSLCVCLFFCLETTFDFFFVILLFVLEYLVIALSYFLET